MSNLENPTTLENKGMFEKFQTYAKMMGPAWLAIALNIGGATVTNASVLASKTGFKFLWAIIPEVFVIWIVCILMVRLTLATGEGPISAARKYLGEWAAVITGASIFIVNTVFHAVQYALLGAVIQSIFGVDQRVGAIVGFVFVILLVFNPAKGEKNIKFIENALRIMVWLLLASFIIILFIVDIDWGGVFRGFIPTISSGSQDMIMLAGLMGAAIAINVPALAAYGTGQRKWRSDKKKLSIFELTYTNTMLVLIQFII